MTLPIIYFALRRRLHCLYPTLVAMLLVLSACGGAGGVGSGGSGTGTLSSFSEGVVSGLGSVIVNGTEFADTQATVSVQEASGSSVNAQARLGQRVMVTYDANNNASSILVLPQLAGPASGSPDASGWLRVAGQWVQVISAANASASRPATLIVGFASSDSIAAGDEIEAHGNWVLDSTRNVWVLMATRIDAISTPGSSILLSGLVQSIGADRQIRLNAANGSVLSASSLPSGLQSGQLVSAWVPRSQWGQSPLPASRVYLPGVAGANASGSLVTMNGLASEFDPLTNTVNVQGMRISLPALSGLDTSALAAGGFVSAQGKGSDNKLQASSANVTANKSGSAPPSVDLKGVVSGVAWNQASISFKLRDTRMQAMASVIDKSCRAQAQPSATYVEVTGNIVPPSTTLIASAVKCSAVAPNDATVERTGQLLSMTGSLITIKADTGVEQISIDSNTYFEKPPASLIGQQVDVEGVVITGSAMLRAKSVRRAQ